MMGKSKGVTNNFKPAMAKFVSVDDKITDFTAKLTEFHGMISAFAIKNSDPELELAINLIAQSMTQLNKRTRRRLNEETFGTEK